MYLLGVEGLYTGGLLEIKWTVPRVRCSHTLSDTQTVLFGTPEFRWFFYYNIY